MELYDVVYTVTEATDVDIPRQHMVHGFHVLIGTIFIAVGLFRLALYHLTSAHHMGSKRQFFIGICLKQCHTSHKVGSNRAVCTEAMPQVHVTCSV